MPDTLRPTLGEQLRAAREAKGLSLEEAERVTRIRARLLAAMEADDFTAWPSPTQTKGFLKNYADYVGLDPMQALTDYEAAQKKTIFAALLPKNGREPFQTPAPRYRPPPPPMRDDGLPPLPVITVRRPRVAWMDFLIAGLVTALLVALLLWGGAQLAASAVTPTPTRAALSGLIATPTLAGTATPTPIPATPTPTLNFIPVNTGNVNVSVLAEQRIWARVLVDGVESFAGLLPPNTRRDFSGQTVIEIVTSNGRGTRIIWNGQDQGALGLAQGQVVIRLFTSDGAQTPTPTATVIPDK
jgi:transcriptional regulator with XRE-family HTH domain